MTVGYVDEIDPQAVKKFLEPLVQRLGVSVIVTDDLASYKQAAQALQLEHQICQFHVRRWVGLATETTVSGTLPGGGKDTTILRVASIVPFLVMKAMALAGRLMEKDAWDVYYCVRYYAE